MHEHSQRQRRKNRSLKNKSTPLSPHKPLNTNTKRRGSRGFIPLQGLGQRPKVLCLNC
jgi:hypothetical protein